MRPLPGSLMRTLSFAIVFGTLFLAGTAVLRPNVDRQAVTQAVYDYVDALYLVDPARIERSVHPDLSKVGFWRSEEGAGYQVLHMTFDELVALAERWNQNGRVDPATAPREVTVLDVLDQTATAKLTAEWGVDYLQLAKYDGTWKIVNVLWQSPPIEPD